MFADSLLESAPHPEHRAAWTKLVSTLLQCTVLAIALAIPLFHIERLQIIPPTPSIQMTSMARPMVHTESTLSNTPAISDEMVQLRFTRRSTGSSTQLVTEGVVGPAGAIPCTANCSGGLSPLGNILNHPGVRVEPPRPPSRPIPVSDMELGDLVHKVLPEYPTIAKQLHIQGPVVLTATIGKDGRVEHVQVLSGPPLLVSSAKTAVEQWQYRPYLLNYEPVVVQTQITVNFVLNRE